MQIKRTRYPNIPGFRGSPCWTVTARWLYADLDVNTRFPYGGCLCIRVGPKHPWPDPGSTHRQARHGFTLDVNAPLGEPNRLYVFSARRQHMIGLATWHDWEPTTTEIRTIGGRERAVHCGRDVRCRPRLVRGQRHNWATGRAWDWQDPAAWRWWVTRPARDRAT